jgi:hypothetical protein
LENYKLKHSAKAAMNDPFRIALHAVALVIASQVHDMMLCWSILLSSI